MTILVYSKFNGENIQESIGKSEYSYYFVLRKFLPVLEEIGRVHIIENLLLDTEIQYLEAQKRGEKCVLLCFTAPHNLVLNLPCPMIPVFAWEYDTIPNESWDRNEMNNWVNVLRKVGAAITHSEHSTEVIRKELGEKFPILSCPAPLAKEHSTTAEEILGKNSINKYKLKLSKEVVDAQTLKHSPLESQKGFAKRIEITHILLQTWAHEVLEELLPKRLYGLLRGTYLFAGTTFAKTVRYISHAGVGRDSTSTAVEATSSIAYEGIIYTSILNISDKRKNYMDMVAAFCYALGDHEDAVLVLKTPVMEDIYFFRQKVTNFLQSLSAFSCQVVVIGNYLDKAAFQELRQATSYYVNTSYGEGQCLPLMEFMANGIPAIAPYATALKDYLNEDNAFLLKTGAAPTCWQHDERVAIRTVHHRPDWYDMVAAYQESYRIAHTDEAKYREMSLAAMNSLSRHASFEKTKSKLDSFLRKQLNE